MQHLIPKATPLAKEITSQVRKIHFYIRQLNKTNLRLMRIQIMVGWMMS